MAAGIFLFDQFPIGWIPLWGLLSVWVLLVLGTCCFFRGGSYSLRLGFGILAGACCFLFGGIRLLTEKEGIAFDWHEERAVYVGRVLTVPQLKGKTFQAEVEVVMGYVFPDSLKGDRLAMDSLFLASAKGSEFPVNRVILWSWMPDSLARPVACGNAVAFEAKVSWPLPFAAGADFDYAEYLLRKGISGTAVSFQGDWEVLEMPCRLSVKQRALLCRDWIVRRYRSWNLGEEELAVVAALTVGDKRILTSDLKESYNAAGVSHVLALSGLHIGILSAVLYFLWAPLGFLRHGKCIRSLGVAGCLWGFAFLTGLGPSVVRAVTMCTLYVGAGSVSEERFPGVYAVTLTAFLMLVYQPLFLFDLSFQLSFAAVYSILYFFPLVSGLLSVKNRFMRYVWDGMAVSVAAQLGTLPLVLHYFGTFPTYFLLANLVVGGLAACILVGALLALATSFVPGIGMVTVEFLNGSTHAMNFSVCWIRNLWGAQWENGGISCSQAVLGVVFLYSLYLFWVRRRPRHLMGVLVALNLSLLEWGYRVSVPSPAELVFSHRELYLQRNGRVEALASSCGLFRVDSLRIGLVKSDEWYGKETEKKIELDYVYLCRGFRGNVRSLLKIFTFREVILDGSLSAGYRKYLIQECLDMKIPYKDISKKGSFIIFL